MCNGCERPPRGKQATYKRLRRKHNGRQRLYKQIGRENQRPCALRQRRDGCFPALSPPVGCKGTCKRQRMRLFVRRAVRFVCPRFFGRPTGMNFVFIRAGRKRLGRVTLLGSRLLRMAKRFRHTHFPFRTRFRGKQQGSAKLHSLCFRQQAYASQICSKAKELLASLDKPIQPRVLTGETKQFPRQSKLFFH